MKKRTPVAKIMTSNPISVNLTNNMNDVVTLFKENKIHHLPVVSGNELLGLISKTDVERISFVNSIQGDKANTSWYDMLSIDQVMTKDIKTVQKDDLIKDAAEMLAQGEYHALPVMDKEGLAGIVTSTDIIRYLLELY